MGKMTILREFDNTRAKFESITSQYKNLKCAVTGGASFIGSHLVDALLSFDCNVIVIDDLTSGKKENLQLSNKNLKFVEGDVTEVDLLSIFSNVDIVFNLAAIHGGRGFIESQGKLMLKNLMIDQVVFEAAISSGVKTIVHASSACAYPTELQDSVTNLNYLSEKSANFITPGGAFADGVYGWTKLMGEFQLSTLVANSNTKGRSARIFTAYGERENESHAAIALIAKSLLKMEPFEVWGSGQQTRNFTYVADTVMGLLLLGQDQDSHYYAANIGTTQHIKVVDFVSEIHKQIDWKPGSFFFDKSKPEGVASRASNNEYIQSKFDWEPSISISEGISATLKWYRDKLDRSTSILELKEKLNAR
jgi:UDP-glucose 4-epimerase